MSIMRTIPTILSLVILASAPLFAQDTPSTLEERMPAADFNASGLNKLSPEELQFLNSWLASHPAPGARGTAVSGFATTFYPDDSQRQTIENKIDGEFVGWRGKTTWRLENGQEWQQVESGLRTGEKLSHPNVRIKPMIFGSWLMIVDGCDCNLRVKRIR